MTRINFSRERGAVLIHVAVAMLGLLAFSALVIDYGIIWWRRRQAQNVGRRRARWPARWRLAYDAPGDYTDAGHGQASASRTRCSAALANESLRRSGTDVDITTGHHVSAVPPDDGRPTRASG